MQSLSATVKIQRGLGTEDLVLPIHDAWLETLDWRVGDTLNWSKRPCGGWQLTNLTKVERNRLAHRADRSDAAKGSKHGRSPHDSAD